ncbi:Amino acid permease domain containing protein [Tylopilus felleus]
MRFQSWGRGLIISFGTAPVRGGPLGLCLSKGYATRFVDPAFGFTVGWNYLLKYVIATASHINAACIVMQYWARAREDAFLLKVLLVNLLGVRVFGELEFWMSGLKLLSLAGFILLGIVLDIGGNPLDDRIGFRGPMGNYLLSHVHNDHLAIFFGFRSTLTTALFRDGAQTKHPKKNVPHAIKRTFVRIFVFYIGSVFVMSLIVPSTSKALFVANTSQPGAAASPVKLSTPVADPGPPPTDLYIASRTLHGLALEGKAPLVFARANWTCLLSVTIFYGLAGAVFGYFVNLLFIYRPRLSRFMSALKVQGISRDTRPRCNRMALGWHWFAQESSRRVDMCCSFIPMRLGVVGLIPIPVVLLGYKVRRLCLRDYAQDTLEFAAGTRDDEEV